MEHFSFQSLSSTPAGAAKLEHVTGGVITQLLLLALTTTSPPTWRVGWGGANGVGCEGRGQEVCRVLPFSPLCPGMEAASMRPLSACLPFWISVCALFILTSGEEQRIPEGEWVSPVLRTAPGSQDPCPGLCWIELVFTKLSDREVVPTAGTGSSGASMHGQRSRSVRGSDESVPRTEKLPFSTSLELFGAHEDAQPLTWTACTSWLPVGCRIRGRVWVHGQVRDRGRDRGRARGLGTKLPQQRSARGVFPAAEQPTGAQKGPQSGCFWSKKVCNFKSYHEGQNIQIQTLRSSWNL